MPLFHRETPQQRLQKDEAEREAGIQEQSRRQLAAGGLPVRAEERIAQIRAGASALFSSDFSPNELLLTRQAGYEPLGLVAGSSMYHIGWNSWLQTGELDAQTRAMAGAAYAAIGRLEQEANGMGAVGVAGVRLRIEKPEWGESMVEFTALGTGLKTRAGGTHDRAFLSGLSGQELWNLLRAGVRPAGLVFGNSAFYIHTDWSARWQNTSWYNQEMSLYSQGLYAAQRAAFGRMHEHARQFQAQGVMGVHIEHSLEVIPVQAQNGDETVEYDDYVIQYLAWGTAIIEAPVDSRFVAPSMFIDLEDVSRMARETLGSEGGE